MSAEQLVWVPFEVDKKYDGLRIDQFLSQRLVGYSRSKVQKILEEARVLKEGRVAKSNTRVRTGDKIDIAYLRRPEVAPAPDITIPVLFEDDHLLVVNKPANVLSHPTDKIVMNTVLALLRRDRPDLPKVHLLHRLDRETSGVLVLGKDPATARKWTAAMTKHLIQKEYVALVRGVPEPAEGIIDWPIGREGGKIRVRQWVNVSGAVEAVTKYKTDLGLSGKGSDPNLKRRASLGQTPFSVVRCFPKTGRLHQIRVHMAALGHPLLGDPLYTGDGEIYLKMTAGTVTLEDRASLGFPRVALHAASITMPHPGDGNPLKVAAPLPPDFEEIVPAESGKSSRNLSSQTG